MKKLIILIVLSLSALANEKPNIIMIITDDMGYSDLGCYGGEIKTPNIDRLADQGVKFSQFYNCGKCEPTRGTIVSGHYWHTSYEGIHIRKDTPSFGEVVKSAGYRTMMVGKWHAHGSPFERGFDRHFGFMEGGTNFFKGDETFTLDGKPWKVPEKDFYVTTALSEYAIKFIKEENKSHPEKPFFMYVAYNAPHSPIQALPQDVAKYRGKYKKGWDKLRKERYERQQKIGLAGDHWNLPERPSGIPAWDTLDEKSKDFEDLRMATYAGMIDCVDRGVGDILKTLNELKISDNTLVIFTNDNGASPNDRVRGGKFGSSEARWNVGLAWANLSNTPFQHYKRTQSAGGVTTPFIVRWPEKIKPKKEFIDQSCHFIDLLPTFMDLSGAKYPENYKGNKMPPLPGRSIRPIMTENKQLASRPLFFQLYNYLAVVDNNWKIRTTYGEDWRLYDLSKDRTETNDLSKTNPEKFKYMLALQKQNFESSNVKMKLKAGESEPKYTPIFDGDKIGKPERKGLKDAAYQNWLVKERAKGTEPDDSTKNEMTQRLANQIVKKKKKKADK